MVEKIKVECLECCRSESHIEELSVDGADYKAGVMCENIKCDCDCEEMNCIFAIIFDDNVEIHDFDLKYYN